MTLYHLTRYHASALPVQQLRQAFNTHHACPGDQKGLPVCHNDCCRPDRTSYYGICWTDISCNKTSEMSSLFILTCFPPLPPQPPSSRRASVLFFTFNPPAACLLMDLNHVINLGPRFARDNAMRTNTRMIKMRQTLCFHFKKGANRSTDLALRISQFLLESGRKVMCTYVQKSIGAERGER